MVVTALAMLLACREEPYALDLSVSLPEGGAELVDGHLLELVATTAAGDRTVLTLGPVENGAPITGVPALPADTTSLGLLFEDDGGTDGAVDLDRAIAWGEVSFDGGTSPGARASAELLVAPFGELLQLDTVAPNRRVVAGAMAVDSRSRVFVFGGEAEGRTTSDRGNAKVYAMSLDAGERKFEPTTASLPKTTGYLPNGLDKTPLDYKGRVGLTATLVEVDGAERILVVGGQPSIDTPFGPSDQALFYDADADTLTAEQMPTARSGHVAIRHANGSVLFYGGFVDNLIPSPSFHHWDPDRGFLERDAVNLVTGAGHVAGAPLGEDAIVCGGDLLTIVPNTEQRWEPQDGCNRIRANGEAREFDPLPQPLSGAAMVALADGSLLISGGFTQPAVDILSGGSVDTFGSAPGIAKAYRWTEAGGWKAVGNLNKARVNHGMVALSDGSALVVGGDEIGTGYLADQVTSVRCAERFDPVTEEWTLLDCGDAVSGAYPMVAVQPGTDVAVVVGGYTFERVGSTLGGLAVAVTSVGPTE